MADLDLDKLEGLWRDQRYSQTHKLLDAMPELIRLARIGQRILSLPIVGEATDPGEQELPAAAAKALPSASRVSTSDRDATEGTSAQQPARPGPSQECVSVPFSIAYHLESMSLEMGGKCHICSQFRSLLATAKEGKS